MHVHFSLLQETIYCNHLKLMQFFHRATGLADLQAKHEKTKLDVRCAPKIHILIIRKDSRMRVDFGSWQRTVKILKHGTGPSKHRRKQWRKLISEYRQPLWCDVYCIGSSTLSFLHDFYLLPFVLKFEELEDEIDVLQGKFSWRKVVNVEHKLEDTKQTLKHCEERLQQNKQEQEKSEQEKDAKEKEASASEEILSDYETHMKVLINKQKQNKLRKRDFNQKKKSAERQIALKKKYAADAVANINRLQMQLTALVKKSAAHSASNKSQIRQVEIDKEQQVNLKFQLSIQMLDCLHFQYATFEKFMQYLFCSTQDLDRMVEALSVKQENMNSEEAHLEKVEQHHRNDVEMKQDSLRSIQQNIKRLCSIALKSMH